jgi:hypothetical protein
MKMASKFKPLIVMLGCGSLVAFSAVMSNASAQTSTSTPTVSSTEQLAAQVASLQTQVNKLERAQRQDKALHAKQSKLIAQNKRSIATENKVQGDLGQRSLIGTYVVTGPAVGMPSDYRGWDLIVNSPNINEDYQLLQRSQQERNALAAKGYTETAFPHVVLSGNVEGQASYTDPYTSGYTSDVNLTAAELDTFVEVDPWVNGFMSYVYDDSATAAEPSRIDNSRLYVDKAFITIGNLNQSPFYGSIGQMYVPFGRYTHITIDDPLTELVGRVKARAISAGFHPNGGNAPYAEVYGFRGNTSYGTPGRADKYGVDGGYQFNVSSLSGDVGASYVSSIGDSQGMLDNGGAANTFTGFDAVNSSLIHRVPGVDAYTSMSYGSFWAIAEYLTATSEFASQDMSYNGTGAKPTAGQVEGIYTIQQWGRPVSFDLSYSQTRQALAMDLPKTRYMAAIQTAITHDVLVELGYRRDQMYSSGTTATGRTSSTTSAAPDVVPTDLGKHANVVAAQLDIYF